jgi:flavocytochrome c
MDKKKEYEAGLNSGEERDQTKGDKLKFTRRQFVGGAGTVLLGGAIGVVTAYAQTPDKVKIEGITQKWDAQTDVLIVGAGGAGLFAAMSAHDAGSKVILLEKEPTCYGSSSAICGGTVTAAGTSVQKDLGIKDSPDLFYKDVMKEGEYTNDEAVLRVFADNAAEIVEWFKAKNLKFIVRSYPGFAVDRLHYAGTGKQYIDILLEESKKRKIPISISTAAKRIIVDSSSGAVLGVEAEKNKKKVLYKARKATVFTTGGFAGDRNMIDRFLVSFKGALVGSAPGATGDGLLMGMKSGSSTTHMGYAAVYAYGVETDPASRRGVLHRGYDLASVFGGILINHEGKRFLKEETSPTGVALKLVGQQNQTVYDIADQVMWDQFLARPVFPVIGWTKEMVEEEAKNERIFIKKAYSISELAGKIGVNADTLNNTIKNYNTFVEQGKDPDFGREKAFLKKKIDVPPFYSMMGKPIAMVTTGGIKINKKCQVLDPYLKPIPRLYAAGEIVGGLHGSKYIGGNGFTSALCFGKLVGKYAAGEKPLK